MYAHYKLCTLCTQKRTPRLLLCKITTPELSLAFFSSCRLPETVCGFSKDHFDGYNAYYHYQIQSTKMTYKQAMGSAMGVGYVQYDDKKSYLDGSWADRLKAWFGLERDAKEVRETHLRSRAVRLSTTQSFPSVQT
jgi:hypothetical protein